MGKCFVDFQVMVRLWAEIQFIMTNNIEIKKTWHVHWKLEKTAFLIYTLQGTSTKCMQMGSTECWSKGLTHDTSHCKATALPKVKCRIPHS